MNLALYPLVGKNHKQNLRIAHHSATYICFPIKNAQLSKIYAVDKCTDNAVLNDRL